MCNFLSCGTAILAVVRGTFLVYVRGGFKIKDFKGANFLKKGYNI